MQIEYEATFSDVDKDKIREKLEKAGAKLIRPEFLQKRYVFDLPKEFDSNNKWLRVRDEGDKVTMTFKIIDGNKIENQKEINLQVNSFDEAKLFLTSIGCRKKAYQETKRELWKIDDVEVTIDEWPFLEPLVEVEGKSEKEVRDISEKLGFDYNNAIFGTVSVLYSKKYGVTEDFINLEVPEIVFDGKNPFIK